MLWKAVLLVALALHLTEGAMLCYYESWAVYRPNGGQVDIEDLDPSICTHYIYAFAGVNTDHTIKVSDPSTDLCDNGGKCGYDRFTAMKGQEPGLLTLLSVGGWNEGSVEFSKMASTTENRATFIKSALELLKAHKFDGLDLDWEFPTLRGGVPEDRENLVHLVRELKEAMKEDGLVLTVAVSPSRPVIDQAYDIPSIASHADLVSVISYDFHGPWENYTHHQSGLYAYPEDNGNNLYLNVDAAVQYWLAGGLPGNKLVMGVPLYGRCWTLDTEKEHGYYAPAHNPGQPGPWTNEAGMLAFSEICKYQHEEDWTVTVANGCNEPYTYYMADDRIWCSYEDHDSVTIKAQYAADQKLAGIMVWSVCNDDVTGSCTGRKFDLTRTLGQTFSGALQ